MAEAVEVTVDGKRLVSPAKVPAGAKLKVRGVPAEAFVALHATVDDSRVPFPLEFRSRPAVWVSDPLPPKSRFTLRVDLPDSSTVTVTGRAQQAAEVAVAALSPSGGVYGVGMPVTVTFPVPVTDRAAVEAGLSVDASQPLGASSWSWTDDKTVVFRPKAYWPARTDVTVTAKLASVQVAPGVWGADASASFATGPSMVFTVDGDDHTMTLVRDGAKVRSFPVSLGKPGWETAAGVKVISEIYESKRMVNSTGPETWDVVSPYAMRLTYTGEFLHGAPWNGAIGSANTSHGCTNVTVDDGRWLFERVRIGDVVEFDDVDGDKVASWNGLGGVWNVPWSTWTAGSALSG